MTFDLVMWPLTLSTIEGFCNASMTHVWLKSTKACVEFKIWPNANLFFIFFFIDNWIMFHTHTHSDYIVSFWNLISGETIYHNYFKKMLSMHTDMFSCYLFENSFSTNTLVSKEAPINLLYIFFIYFMNNHIYTPLKDNIHNTHWYKYQIKNIPQIQIKPVQIMVCTIKSNGIFKI